MDSTNYVCSGTSNSTRKLGKKQCYHCGGKHSPQDCRFKAQHCNKCNKRGHIDKMCQSDYNTSSTSTKVIKKVQYIADTTPFDLPNSTVEDDDLYMFA